MDARTTHEAGSGASTIHPSAIVGDDVEVGREVSVGPGAVVLDAEPGEAPTALADGVQIGANATICAGCQVGMRARVLPGAVVQRAVPPLAIVEGNPGRIIGYAESERWQETAGAAAKGGAQTPRIVHSRVRGVQLHHMPVIKDLRGTLSPGEVARDVPFAVRRYFLVYGVPSAETRGEHAHHQCAQFLLAVSGHLSVLVDDGQRREEFTLDRPNVGLLIPPMVWGVQYRYQPNTVLLVFASEHYQASDYIRDYAQFLALTEAKARRRPPSSRADAAAARLDPIEVH